MNLVELYKSGMTIMEVSVIAGMNYSATRNKLIGLGCEIRSMKNAQAIAAKKGRKGLHAGRTFTMSQKQKEKIKEARIKWGKSNAVGFRVTTSGYVEFTTGEHKGKMLHRVLMEQEIGRKLNRKEHVHHIDENKLNNVISNLKILSISEHMSLHAEENHANRVRNEIGRFI